MFIPYRDDNESLDIPYVTIGLGAVNILIFLFTIMLGLAGYIRFIFTFGFIPAELLQGISVNNIPAEIVSIPGMEDLVDITIPNVAPVVTMFTSSFLHGGFDHIISNIWFLWLFADNVEDRMGMGRFIIFYFICAFAADLAHAFASPDSMIPAIGASGAISGVMGAYIYLFPRANIRIFYWFFIFYHGTLNVSSLLFIGGWFILQVFSGISTFGSEGAGVAFFAHIGGFIAGLLLIIIFDKLGWVYKYGNVRPIQITFHPKPRKTKDHWPR